MHSSLHFHFLGARVSDAVDQSLVSFNSSIDMDSSHVFGEGGATYTPQQQKVFQD